MYALCMCVRMYVHTSMPTQVETHFSCLVVWDVVITDPHSQVTSLKLCRHQGIELEGGAQPSALFVSELGLRKQSTHQLSTVQGSSIPARYGLKALLTFRPGKVSAHF